MRFLRNSRKTDSSKTDSLPVAKSVAFPSCVAPPAAAFALKTLHLTNYWHPSAGGVSTFYRALMETAAQRGRAMCMVVPSDETRVEDVNPFVRVYHIEAPRAPLNASYRLVLPHRFVFPRTAIRKILLAERPDVVEICDKYSLVYLGGMLREKMIRGLDYRPLVLGLSCERMDENMAAYLTRGRLGQAFARWYMKNIYFPLFDHHIAVSEHTAGELRAASRGHKVRRGVWTCANGGVDCEMLTPARRSTSVRADLIAKAGARDASTLLLYVGRLAPEKNLPLLTQMLERLVGDRDYRLLVGGDGILRQSWERECERVLPGRVTFLGHIGDRAALADLYANCDVFVHPNPREPFGIAPLEAMASGLPLVGPDSGGVTSYANESNAWLVDANAEAYARAVADVVASVELRERRTAGARATALEFSWPSVTARYLELYEELHARFHGNEAEASIAPHFFSTPGDYWGREITAFVPRPNIQGASESADRGD